MGGIATDSIEMKLNELIEGMDKKEAALIEIASITDNQRTVIESGLTEQEIRAFIVQMNREKQAFIKTVLSCDAMFENLLKEIGVQLDENPTLYKPQIADLQARIRRVMDLDVKIRVCEDQNNRRLNQEDSAATISLPVMPSAQTAQSKLPVIKDESRVIKAYETNTKNYKG